MEYPVAYTEEDVKKIVNEVLKLVDSDDRSFDLEGWKEHGTVDLESQLGVLLNEHRTGDGVPSSGSGELNDLLAEYDCVDDVGDVRELVRREDDFRSNTPTSKVEKWTERAELADDVDGVLAEAEQAVSKPTYYKIRDAVGSDRPYQSSG